MQPKTSIAGVVCALWLATAACGSDPAAKSDDAGPKDAGTVDAGPPLDPNGPWAKVYEQVIIPNNCDNTFCHGHAAELNLSQEEGYQNLVGVSAMGKDCKGKTTKKRVEPGDPDASLLIEKLTKPSCGMLMPLSPQPKVTAAQLKILRAWITDGAKRN